MKRTLFGNVHGRCPRSLVAALMPVILVFLLAGCAHPMGAKRVSGRASYQQLDRSALNSGECSSDSQVVLHRYDLTRQFSKDPEETLRVLHGKALTDERRSVLFALAELNFLHGERLQRSIQPDGPVRAPDYFLSSAIYAYLYLLGEGREPAPDAFDRRFHLACGLYNRAVAQGFATTGHSDRAVRMEGGIRQLPGGAVEVKFNQDKFKWKLEEIERFLPSDEFEINGFAVRDRLDGLGSPLIVVGKTLDQKKYGRRFPATLFLRVPADLKAWSEGRLTVSLELISTYDYRTVEVAGREIRLEADTTAPLAYGLNDASLWKLGMAQFFSAEERVRSGVYLSQPYQPGRIPVVFVHGTASSPIWWAEMWNTLRTDSVLRERVQFWYFVYPTGKPVSHSANRLREELTRKLQQLDPEGKDPALRQMVVIGHSQGGLLTKLAVTDSGDRLWHTVSTNDFSKLEVSPEIRGVLQTNFFFKPLPFVERVVFVSTPHRGSYLATSLVRKITHMFMHLPQTIVNTPANLAQLREQLNLPKEVRAVVPTSIDGMSPKNKWLLELAEIPPAPGVKAHSIVAVKGRDIPPAGGDGVVKYTSAHVPYVESEFVVSSSHSCQGKPAAIEEVRRILLLHLSEKAIPPVQ